MKGAKGMLITDPLVRHASQQPNKIAIDTGKQQVSYAQLYDHLSRIASQLDQYKQENPTHAEYKLAILLPNSIDFLMFFLAAGMAGWIAAPFDPKWSEPELAATVESCQPQILVVDEAYVDRLAALTLPPHSLVIHSQSVPSRSLKRPRNDEISDQSPFYMGYTSGTTGKPKGFLRSHRSWVKSFEGCQIAFGLDVQDLVLIPGPLVHSHFLCAAVYTLFTGATVILLEKFSPGKLIDGLIENPVSVLYMVPSMFEALFAELDQRNIQLSGNSVRQIISSGAKWNADPKKKICKWFPHGQLFEYYGASELSFVTVLDPEGNETKPDSVGRPFPGVVVSIRDENGHEADSGQIGKLYVQSDLVFLGYCGQEEETKQVLLANGWATVHDFAWKDEDGYLFLAGREKNMIIYGGLNVFPEEIEKVLEGLPQIEEAVVFGKPDKYWGEKVAAAIRYKQNQAMKPWEVQAHCRKYLAAYKCPREIIELKEIPYTSSGKIARSVLKELLVKGAKE
jgi:long-chain acyl-CoA synthetase